MPTSASTAPWRRIAAVVAAAVLASSLAVAAGAAAQPVTTRAATALPVLQRVSTNGFTHPGVLNGAASLEASRTAALAGRAPWKPALEQLKTSRFAGPGWTPRPVAYVGCGSSNQPDEGCTAELDDAQAAYTHALLWYHTGNPANAAKAKEILNAWSAVLKDHRFDTTTYGNGLLQAAWAGETFTKAAELLRYSGAGWSAGDVARFETMLRTAVLPRVRNGWTWTSANWQLSMAEATMNIGVFTNDRAVYDDGVGDWRNHVKGSFYLVSDGPKPYFPTGTIMTDGNYRQYWNSPTAFVSGLGAETCRDAGHLAMGLGAALNAAETARVQGLDLYGEQRSRLVAAMEFNARFLTTPTAPGWPCPKPLVWGGAGWKLTGEVGYQHYAARLGTSMPETRRLLAAQRPSGSALFLNWETLTHGTAF